MAKGPKRKSKLRTAIKWFRRISLVAGILGAIRQYQVERNEANQPPRV